MKIHTFFFVLLFFALTAKAQYDSDYNFWRMAVSPVNNGEMQIRREGYKNLVVVVYKTDEDEGTQKLLGEIETVFDKKGKAISVTVSKINMPYPAVSYVYDKRGKVDAFTYKRKNGSEYTMEFVYDRRLGFKRITLNDPVLEWDTIKNRIIETTDTCTVYTYFAKAALPSMCIKVHRKKGDTKGFGNTDSSLYYYDRFDMLSGFYSVITDKAGRKAWEITGEYTYNPKKQMTKAVINRFDHTYNPNDPKIVEEHTFTYDKTTGNLLLHQKSVRSYFVEGDKVKHDEWFTDTEYAYNDKNLPISHTETNTPGDKKLFVYRYSK